MANRTAYDLVKYAYRLIGLNSPDDALTGGEAQEGLDYLNDLLDSFQGAELLIPYLDEVSFNLTANQDTYIFSSTNPAAVGPRRIAGLTYVNITIDEGIIYPVNIISQSEYYTSVRYLSNVTIPQYVILRNGPVDSKIIFYPIPKSTYAVKVIGKFALENLEPNITITTLPPYYYRFLKYALARELASVFKDSGIKWGQKEEDEYQDLFDKTIGANDIDLQLNLTGTLSKYHLIDRYVH